MHGPQNYFKLGSNSYIWQLDRLVRYKQTRLHFQNNYALCNHEICFFLQTVSLPNTFDKQIKQKKLFTFVHLMAIKYRCGVKCSSVKRYKHAWPTKLLQIRLEFLYMAT